MSSRKKIAVIFGGQSTEHDVSIISAASICNAMDRSLFEPVPVAIDKTGKWFLGEGAFELLSGSEPKGLHRVILSTDPDRKGFLSLYDGTLFHADAVFPALHGPRGEDGTIQGMMDLAGIPYIGCGTLASAIALDKDFTKRIIRQRGLPVVHGTCVNKYTWQKERDETLKEILASIAFPVFVKPATMGSSIGIRKALDINQLEDALAEGFKYSLSVLVEEAVVNPLEIEVSILGNDDPKASIPGQIIPKGEFYDFNAKYVDGTAELVIPAQISHMMSEKVMFLSREAFKAISGSGLARIDFLVSGENAYINEINTMPGFTSISMYPKLWEATGIPYPLLVTKLIGLAFSRFENENALIKTIALDRPLGV